MYIKQIRLKNYRCYKKAEIKFGLKNKRNINLGTGEIKAGKTTLFNAVGWCLYGEETQFLLGTKKEDKDEKPVPNEKSYKQDKSIVGVEIDIKIPEGNYVDSLSIRRTCMFIRGARLPTTTNFTIDAYHGGDKVGISDYSKFLNVFLPKDLIQFYLFDGEYLQHTAANSNLQIKEGLKKLFNIERIENAREMIDELVGDWYKQSGKMPKQNSKIAEIDSKIAIFLEKKRDEGIRIEGEEEKKIKFKSQRDILKEELEKEKEYQEAINKFSSFEKQIRDIEIRLKQEDKANRKDILTNSYLINAKTMLQQVNGIIKKDPRVEGLPANVRQMLLNHLLERRMCVCGKEIVGGSDEEKSIMNELRIVESEGRLDLLLDLTQKIPIMLTTIGEKVNSISEKSDEIKELEAEKKAIIRKKDEIQKELPEGEIDVNTYQNRLNKFTTLSDEITEIEKNIINYKNNVKEFDIEIRKLERDHVSFL